MTGDRLSNASLMENMELLQLLCGGQDIW